MFKIAGGLNPPISYNDEHFSVGTYPWNVSSAVYAYKTYLPMATAHLITMHSLALAMESFVR